MKLEKVKVQCLQDVINKQQEVIETLEHKLEEHDNENPEKQHRRGAGTGTGTGIEVAVSCHSQMKIAENSLRKEDVKKRS